MLLLRYWRNSLLLLLAAPLLVVMGAVLLHSRLLLAVCKGVLLHKLLLLLSWPQLQRRSSWLLLALSSSSFHRLTCPGMLLLAGPNHPIARLRPQQLRCPAFIIIPSPPAPPQLLHLLLCLQNRLLLHLWLLPLRLLWVVVKACLLAFRHCQSGSFRLSFPAAPARLRRIPHPRIIRLQRQPRPRKRPQLVPELRPILKQERLQRSHRAHHAPPMRITHRRSAVAAALRSSRLSHGSGQAPLRTPARHVSTCCCSCCCIIGVESEGPHLAHHERRNHCCSAGAPRQ